MRPEHVAFVPGDILNVGGWALTINQLLTVLLGGMVSVLAFFLKRFVDAFDKLVDRLDDHGERIAGIEAHLDIGPRRRKGDR